MIPGVFLDVLGEALTGLWCDPWESPSEVEDLLIGLEGLEYLWCGSDGLEHLSMGPDGLEDLFREIGELAVLGGEPVEPGELGELEARGGLILMGLWDSLIDVDDLLWTLTGDLQQLSSSGPAAVSSSNLLDAI